MQPQINILSIPLYTIFPYCYMDQRSIKLTCRFFYNSFHEYNRKLPVKYKICYMLKRKNIYYLLLHIRAVALCTFKDINPFFCIYFSSEKQLFKKHVQKTKYTLTFGGGLIILTEELKSGAYVKGISTKTTLTIRTIIHAISEDYMTSIISKNLSRTKIRIKEYQSEIMKSLFLKHLGIMNFKKKHSVSNSISLYEIMYKIFYLPFERLLPLFNYSVLNLHKKGIIKNNHKMNMF